MPRLSISREVVDRQRKVYNFRVIKHWEVADIAEYLKVCEDTVYQDLKAVRGRFHSDHGKDLSDNIYLLVEEELAVYRACIKKLWEFADKEKNSFAIVQILREIRENRREATKMMREYGVLKPSKDDGMDTLADMLMRRTKSNISLYGQT